MVLFKALKKRMMKVPWARLILFNASIIVLVILGWLGYMLVVDPRLPTSGAPSGSWSVLMLHDGRSLSFQDAGDRLGSPVVFLHDTPGSRLQRHPAWEELAEQMSARLITVDRPGVGRSTAVPAERSMVQWCEDLEQLADALNLERFSLAGYGVGGSYALACAARLSRRLSAVGLVGPLAPDTQASTHSLQNSALRAPWLLRLMLKVVRYQFFTKPQSSVAGALKKSAPKSKPTAFPPAVREMMARDMHEAMWDGVEGVLDDLRRERLHRGFALRDVPSDVEIYLWACEDDVVCAADGARALEQALPLTVSATYLPNCTHVDLLLQHWPMILERLGEDRLG